MDEKTIQKEVKTREKDSKRDRNYDFLIELYKNVQMGKLAFEYLLPKTKDGKLKDELLKQYHDFEKLTTTISGAIIELGRTPETALGMAKPMLKCSINMATLFNSSTEKIADMVIQGDNQGIMDINRLINASTGYLPEKTLKLAQILLETEQRHIDKLKAFL